MIRAFGLWKDWAKQPLATLTMGDTRARLLQDRLDAYGSDSFELVLLGADKDDWVQGRKDGTEHKRLDYLLGNSSPAKYEELLQAGQRIRNRAQPKPPPSVRRARQTEAPEDSPEQVLAAIEELKKALGAPLPTPQREAVGE